MKPLVTFLSAVALAVVAAVACPTRVLAQSPLMTSDALTISIQVDEAGGWTAYIGEDQTGITAADFGGLMKLLGFDIPTPTLDASMVQAVTDSGVESIGLVKDGEVTTILVNGAAVSAVHLADAAVTEVTNQFMPELEGMVSWLNTTKIALIAYFPGEGGAAPTRMVTLDTKMPDAPDGITPANVVEVGATFAPSGELVSVGGVSATELGVPAMQVDLSWLETLGVDSADVSIDAYGATLMANGEEWASVSWDVDALVEAAPDIASAAGFPLASEDVAALSLGADWLKDSRLTVQANIGDAAKEAAPVVDIGRAVQIGVTGTSLVVEGFDTGFMLDPYMMSYVESIGSASVTWDGPNRELRTLVGGKAMPAIVADADFVTTVGAATMGSAFLPWDTLSQFLSQTSLAADFVYGDAKVAEVASIDYEATYQEPTAPLALDLQVSRKDGRVAAWGEAIPLDMIDPWLSQTVLLYVGEAGPELESLSLDIGPTGLRIGVNDSHVQVVWNAELRDNLTGLLLDVGGKEFSLPAVATSGLVRTGLQYLLGAANQVELGVRVELTDQEIPEGSIESLVRQVAFY